MAEKYEEIEKMTDKELIDKYNQHAENTYVGTKFYLDELVRRKNDKESKRVLKISKQSLEVSKTSFKVALMSLIITAIFSLISAILDIITYFY